MSSMFDSGWSHFKKRGWMQDMQPAPDAGIFPGEGPQDARKPTLHGPRRSLLAPTPDLQGQGPQHTQQIGLRPSYGGGAVGNPLTNIWTPSVVGEVNIFSGRKAV